MNEATRSELIGFLAHADPVGLAWIGIAFAFVLVHFLSEPLRWRVLFPDTASMTTWISVFGLTALVSYIFPFKLGIPLRVYFLHQTMRLSLTKVAGAMGLDALVYYGGWLFAGVFGFVLLARTIAPPEFPVVAVVSVSLASLIIGIWIVPRALRAISRFELYNRINLMLAQFTLSRMVLIGVIIAIDIMCQLLRHAAIAQALDLPIDVAAIGALTAIAILVGLLSFTPMGLGGYDAVMVTGLLQFGAPLSTALILVLLNRLLTISAALLIGGIGGWALRLNPLNLSALRQMLAREKTPYV
ncbi:membrane hypothetical protein [Thiocapsa sp. KS1]|nr:lysylphosphatidylglycerol synthase domain-containing protein [Thiocapsa sp. KS1]CRI66649.1 membrane hypothetical protein [Thiocapsa sp. KS1]